MEGIIQCAANYVPLSPISFLERAALVHKDVPSIVYGDLRFTWGQTLSRCKSLASALVHQLDISHNNVVATFLPNTPPAYELHFGVPMAGGILCVLNTSYDSTLLSVLLRQCEAKIIFVDEQFVDVVQEAIQMLSKSQPLIDLPSIVLVLDSTVAVQSSSSKANDDHVEYESLLSRAKVEGFEVRRPKDEWDPITVSYTSGTTAIPKGVVYNHRGAYLNSIAAIHVGQMGGSSHPVYLWIVPMFHCNGWCQAWAMAALGGTNICLRSISSDGSSIFDDIVHHGVTHMGGAPAVLNMIINAPCKKPLPTKVSIMTGGAPPPSQVLLKMEELGFNVIHAYGMTEVYGPGAMCLQQPNWETLSLEERASMNARQGLNHMLMESIDVKDPTTMASVAWDGKTVGEVMLRGNTVMSGYLKDKENTLKAFEGGWFRTGDLGVRHSDGYVEFKDRSLDIIVCGGEKISSIEVESVLFKHPMVLEAAVVARPDDRRGETLCAFVHLKSGGSATAEELMSFCGDRLPEYMVPHSVVFDQLPKTATGKTQKLVLRERARAMGSL